jgi:anti-sigma factor RsiW
MTCADVERDLDAYVDRELDPASRAALRNHLLDCLACRRRVEDRGTLGRLVRSLPYHTAPDHLRARALAPVRRWPWRTVAWAAAAALAVSVSGGVALLRLPRASGTPGADAVMADVVNSHVRSLMVDHLLDVQSTDQHTVKPWFAGKLDFSPPVQDLTSIGYPLAGARIDYLSERPVAVLVYRRQQHAISVFVWPAAESVLAPLTWSMRGFHVKHWIRNGMSFWAVSDLNDAELSGLVRSLQASQ